MSASDDEFEHYVNELNEILVVEFSHGLSRLPKY